jgi:hypothetical protein
VNAFDQPDVQDNKVRTQRIINDINVNGRILDEKPQWTDQRFHVFSQSVDWLKEKEMVRDIIRGFIAQGRRGDYVSIMTYLPKNEKIMKTVESLRDWIYESSNLATTVGFGPRFLHSTGQLHKGGSNTGLFIQITGAVKKDLTIPGMKPKFGQIQLSQAMGDYAALVARGRKVLRIHLLDRADLNKII